MEWGRAWSEGGNVGRREGGGREIRTGQAAGAGRGEGGKDGREGDTINQCQAWVMHRSMPVVVSIHSVLTCWREGLRVVGRARRGPGKEGGTSCC